MPENSGKKAKVTVVIPALNEQETIGAVIDGVRRHADEVVLVDDGSCDATALIADAHGAVVFSHTKNEGYDRSIGDGFRLAVERGADIVLTFDADGQHLAESIPAMIEPILKGTADVVVGRRPYRARIGEHLFAWAARLKAGIDDPLCGLKAYRSEVYRKIGYFDRCQSIGTELMFAAVRRGYRIAQKDICLNQRQDAPRFGRSLKANYKIVRAIFKTLPL